MSQPTAAPTEDESLTNLQAGTPKPKKKGKSLPPKLIIKLGKFVWTTLWHIMMSNLAPRNKQGEYIRPSSQFRNFVGTEEGNPYQPAAGRYNLYVGLSCPWAHPTLVFWAPTGLEYVG